MQTRREALQIMGAAGIALATLDTKALAKPVNKTPKEFPFRKNLGWFGEVQSNKDFSVSPTIRYGKVSGQYGYGAIIPGFNVKWEDGPIEFVSIKNLTDFRRGFTEEIVLDNPGWKNYKGIRARYHIYPEPYHVFRVLIGGKQLLIQSWEKDCKVNGMFEAVDIQCGNRNKTLFPPFFEQEISERYYSQRPLDIHRCTKNEIEYGVGNILMTIDVLPMTLNWVVAASVTQFGGTSAIEFELKARQQHQDFVRSIRQEKSKGLLT